MSASLGASHPYLMTSRPRELTIEREPAAPATSLLSASLANTRHELFTQSSRPPFNHKNGTVNSPLESPSTPLEGGSNFRRSLQIDMKELVGDAVGNVSCVASGPLPPSYRCSAAWPSKC